MTIVIKKPITKAKLEKAEKLLRKNKTGKGFNADLFLGKVQWEMDGVKMQRMMRDEWS